MNIQIFISILYTLFNIQIFISILYTLLNIQIFISILYTLFNIQINQESVGSPSVFGGVLLLIF